MHQPPSIGMGGASISPEILSPLLVAMTLTIIVAGLLIKLRWENLELELKLERRILRKLQAAT